MSLPLWQEGKNLTTKEKTPNHKLGEDTTFQGSMQTEGQIVPQAQCHWGNQHILLACIFPVSSEYEGNSQF